jgi:hypothetical protein
MRRDVDVPRTRDKMAAARSASDLPPRAGDGAMSAEEFFATVAEPANLAQVKRGQRRLRLRPPSPRHVAEFLRAPPQTSPHS